jgi:phosphohistidine phosphatase SixA
VLSPGIIVDTEQFAHWIFSHANYGGPVTLYLVRHATAGQRSPFDNDLERQLSDVGHEQAAALTEFFAEMPVRSVWSSLATRCFQTVRSIAAHHGLEVVPQHFLTEGARPVDFLEALRAESSLKGDLVLCSHGDLIPEVLSRLLREGLTVVGSRGCEKGSVWSIETRGRDMVRASYTARPMSSGD